MSGIGLDLTFPSTVTREKIPTKTIQSWNFPKANDDSTDEDLDEGAESFFELMKLQLGPLILRLIICIYDLGTALKMRTPSAFPVTRTQVRYCLKVF